MSRTLCRFNGSAAAGRTLAIIGSLCLGACAQGGLDGKAPEAGLGVSPTETSSTAQSDLQKAVEYWGKEFEKKPSDLNAALSFARNLKATGAKERAVAVLQQASMFHPHSKELQSEYGRLALELDQISLAQQLLQMADDPAKPDWRVISGRGTAHAKQGQYSEAIAQFERALAIAPSQTSVMNNLAMAYAANGQADKAEELLRQAITSNPSDVRLTQNLALVLGLQGKYDEAKQVASRDTRLTATSGDVDTLRKFVRAQPQAAPGVVRADAAGRQVIAQSAAGKSASAPASALRGPDTSTASAAGAGTWTTKVARTSSAPSSGSPALRSTR
jgi:Flp pilus assembly protein TadD